jgi:hypothetical protein
VVTGNLIGIYDLNSDRDFAPAVNAQTTGVVVSTVASPRPRPCRAF